MLTSTDKPLSETALRQITEKALDKGWIREAFHSDVDRSYRNISADDILYGLERNTWVIEKSEPAREKGRFKYTIRTSDIEGDELHLVILPTGAGTVTIITKY